MVQEKEPDAVRVEKGELGPDQMEEVESGEFLTTKQVATKLQYSYQWVQSQLQTGRIKGIKPMGGKWRIPKSEVDRIIKEGLPPLPRQPKETPPLTEIHVNKSIEDKVKEAPRKKEERPRLFQFGDIFGGKKK